MNSLRTVGRIKDVPKPTVENVISAVRTSFSNLQIRIQKFFAVENVCQHLRREKSIARIAEV